MAHTYEELKKMKVAELRDIAKELDSEAVQGYTQMNKEHLLPAVCKALGIDTHEHHTAALSVKATTRAKMRELKALKAQAITAGDHAQVKTIRRHYHRLNHQLREAARRSV